MSNNSPTYIVQDSISLKTRQQLQNQDPRSFKMRSRDIIAKKYKQLTQLSLGRTDVHNKCRQELCIQNCGETAADRDLVRLTTYMNSASLYPAVGYHRDVPFSHNTYVTDKQTTDRRQLVV